jgi:UDP-N-acetyl-2-amino-2-deoxyglucuronate dehydrogenase
MKNIIRNGGRKNMKFGIIGVGGYVAPRHLQAIKDTGNELKVALDLNDSVGIIDKYFPNCKFFTKQEAFDRHIVKYEDLDYISVCSPNFLHETHCKLGMRLGANVICEKPLSTTVDNLMQLKKVENMTSRRVFSILQLRLHPSISQLRNRIDINKKYLVNLQYITPREEWYFQTWKGREKQSGGIEANIGIHFFDLLIWLFGDVQKVEVTKRDKYVSSGVMDLERANVEWFLSLNKDHLPSDKESVYRRMVVDGEEVVFDNIASDLHTISYQDIISGYGYGIDDSIKSIDLIERIREG